MKNGCVFDIPFEQLQNSGIGSKKVHSLDCVELVDKSKLLGFTLYLKTRCRGHSLIFLELVNHFMDVSRPLPDIPELEPYRHLDSTTREWDKENSRLERLWRDMLYEEYEALVEASLQAVESYPFLNPRLVKKKGWKHAGDGKHWYQIG
jgi:hypothetical protein